MNTRKMKKTWAVVQYDNRPLQNIYKVLQQHNINYCKKYGYKYFFISEKYELPPYWIKVKIVQEILKTNKYKGVLWLDMDAVIHDTNISLDSLLIKGKSFYYAPDRPEWNTPFNAGVWFVLNNKIGNAIVDSWINTYKPEYWMEKNGKWITNGPWAGITYEQGSFIHYIKPIYMKYINEFPWHFLQSHEPSEKSFILHFAVNYKRFIQKYITGHMNF